MQALGGATAGLDAVFNPSIGPREEFFKALQRLFVSLVIPQFPCIIKQSTRIQRFAAGDQLLIDAQVASALACPFLAMANDRIPIDDPSARRHRLMHRSFKSEAHRAAEQSLPIVGQRRLAARVEPHIVGQHHDIRVLANGPLERDQPLGVLRLKHIVRIHPEEKVLRRLGKGIVARKRKVVLPGKIIDPIGKPARDVPGVIRGTRVDDHDLVHGRGHRFQAAGQMPVFVSHDHAKADGRAFNAFVHGVSLRTCIFTPS